MSHAPSITILFFGDIVGKPGRRALRRFLSLADSRSDLIVANVENAAAGFGVTESIINELAEAGVRVFSGGNHSFDQKEIFGFIERIPGLLRPANYPPDTPGRGHCVIELESGVKVAFLNLLGRVFMEPLASPYLVADQILPELAEQTNIIFVDIHAEATAEKVSMGWYLDGRVSAVVGTHTHVQTADERILPQGTAYITDVGCCGAADGVIGMNRDDVFRRMIKQLPQRLGIAPGPAAVCGVKVVIDSTSGRALSIERIFHRESDSETGEDD